MPDFNSTGNFVFQVEFSTAGRAEANTVEVYFAGGLLGRLSVEVTAAQAVSGVLACGGGTSTALTVTAGSAFYCSVAAVDRFGNHANVSSLEHKISVVAKQSTNHTNSVFALVRKESFSKMQASFSAGIFLAGEWEVWVDVNGSKVYLFDAFSVLPLFALNIFLFACTG